MPIHSLVCYMCGAIIEEVFINSSILEFEALRTEDGTYCTESFDICCPKCDGTVFKKIPTPHGNNSANWSKWRRRK